MEERDNRERAPALFVIAFLVFMNREAIIGRYLAEPVGLIVRGDKNRSVLNFFLLAVPEQIVPGFVLGFSHNPLVDLYRAQFAASRMDALWSACGALITAIVLVGAWRIRGRMLPELMMIIAVLPLLVAIMPSTSRYFMTYQPFFWIAFLEGSRGVGEWIPAAARQFLASRARIIATAACFVVLAIGVQASKAPGLLLVETVSRCRAVGLPRHVHGVSDTYRPLRRFLEGTSGRDRALLTSSRLSMGRWKVIANLDSYAPDSGLVEVAAQKDVYMIVECGSADLCALQDWRESRPEGRAMPVWRIQLRAGLFCKSGQIGSKGLPRSAGDLIAGKKEGGHFWPPSSVLRTSKCALSESNREPTD